ncbi:hypothetical protein E2320_006652 [Naja naja]|nr:hypothetical protein E2320_006652 [Naja naja]
MLGIKGLFRGKEEQEGVLGMVATLSYLGAGNGWDIKKSSNSRSGMDVSQGLPGIAAWELGELQSILPGKDHGQIFRSFFPSICWSLCHFFFWTFSFSPSRNVPPDYVQSRYYTLKTSYVPFWYEKTFPEIIDYLFEETLPTLKETHERVAQRQRAPQEERSCKTSFRFDDIFQDMLEDELLNDEDLSDEETGEPSQADD